LRGDEEYYDGDVAAPRVKKCLTASAGFGVFDGVNTKGVEKLTLTAFLCLYN
jgi:hypothetical protein